MATIQALPEIAAAQVKASVLITSLHDVIIGLVENSLDSDATRIEIEVDFEKGFCTVEDDGVGIPPTDFSEDGGLAKIHHTSKSAESLYLHGRRGVFLWAVSALATLTVVSLREPGPAGSSMTIHQGQAILRDVSLETLTLRHLRHGTRVEVRNLFGNMPVRARQRPKVSDGSCHRAWKRAIKDLTGTLLAWGKSVDVSLKSLNGSQKMRVPHTNRLEPSASTETIPNSTSRLFHLPVLKSIMLNGTTIDSRCLDEWISTSAMTTRWTVRAFLSLQPWPSREVQFICLGAHHIKESDSLSVLYDEVNNIYEYSSFAAFGDYNQTANATDGDYKSRRVRHPKKEARRGKGVEKSPMFFLRVDDNSGSSYRPSDHNKSVENEASIMPIIRVLIESFLTQNNIRLWSTKGKRQSTHIPLPSADDDNDLQDRSQSSLDQEASRPAALASRAPTTTADMRTMIKEGRRALSSLQMTDRPPTHPSLSHIQTEALDGNTAEHTMTTESSLTPTLDGEDHELTVRDHNSNAHLPTSQPSTAAEGRQSAQSQFFPQSATRNASSQLSRPVEEMSEAVKRTPWASDLLARWENPVYKANERSIPQLPSQEFISNDSLFSNQSLESQCSLSMTSESMLIGAKIGRGDLLNAETVSQVDGKFILIKIKPSTSPHYEDVEPTDMAETKVQELLVLIDQHAADERVRVEALLADLCKPNPPRLQDFRSPLGCFSAINIEILSPVIGFDLNEKECELFRGYAKHFARWGILYGLGHDRNEACTSGEHSLFVLSLPPLISERCRAEPKLLSDFLRRDAWSFHEKGSAAGPTQLSDTADSETVSFWSKLHTCPEGILDMVNSRACRSAIMFNDSLAISECQELIQRLGRCKLPFQCAHGRPSMVPIATLEAVSQGWSTDPSANSASRAGRQPEGFLSAWKHWDI